MTRGSDDPDRSHDTDPLADTQAPVDSEAGEPAQRGAARKRSVRAGDVLGRYELIEEVGEGGMATVYRARDRELRREVAIKVLFPHLARRDEVVHRFHREARAAAGLEHANILRIYDVGGAEGDDPPHIVMELIRGRSLLGEIEQRGPMLAEVAACIGALLADALGAAHTAGIIHRDIKPANVLIAPGGRVLLADFGVARLETEDSLVTKTGALLGTPAYMSPEQASGDTATAKSDLYSLGATLYQLATGSLPYTGSPAKVMAQLAQGAMVSAVRKRAEVGPDLSRVIDRLMATEPTARPGSAAEVAGELRALAAAGGLGEPTDELAAYFADPDAFVRARTPKLVASLVTAAERAIADAKLPRAMALAERASALAPADPAVATLIEKVTEGGRASRRRRVLALAGAGVALAAGTTLGVRAFVGHHGTAAADAALLVAQADAAVAAPDATRAAVEPDAAAVAMVVDAGVVALARRDAGTGRRADAAVVALAADAAVEVSHDAAIAETVLDAAVVRPGSIVVKSDAWCDVGIDGTRTGFRNDQSIPIAAGHHVVTCAQGGTGKTWTHDVDVAPGEAKVVRGELLGLVDVRLDVDATIDGIAYRRGAVAHVKGRLEVVAGAKKTYVTFRVPCTVRDTPELDCY